MLPWFPISGRFFLNFPGSPISWPDCFPISGRRPAYFVGGCLDCKTRQVELSRGELPFLGFLGMDARAHRHLLPWLQGPDKSERVLDHHHGLENAPASYRGVSGPKPTEEVQKKESPRTSRPRGPKHLCSSREHSQAHGHPPWSPPWQMSVGCPPWKLIWDSRSCLLIGESTKREKPNEKPAPAKIWVLPVSCESLRFSLIFQWGLVTPKPFDFQSLSKICKNLLR